MPSSVESIGHVDSEEDQQQQQQQNETTQTIAAQVQNFPSNRRSEHHSEQVAEYSQSQHQSSMDHSLEFDVNAEMEATNSDGTPESQSQSSFTTNDLMNTLDEKQRYEPALHQVSRKVDPAAQKIAQQAQAIHANEISTRILNKTATSSSGTAARTTDNTGRARRNSNNTANTGAANSQQSARNAMNRNISSVLQDDLAKEKVRAMQQEASLIAGANRDRRSRIMNPGAIMNSGASSQSSNRRRQHEKTSPHTRSSQSHLSRRRSERTNTKNSAGKTGTKKQENIGSSSPSAHAGDKMLRVRDYGSSDDDDGPELYEGGNEYDSQFGTVATYDTANTGMATADPRLMRVGSTDSFNANDGSYISTAAVTVDSNTPQAYTPELQRGQRNQDDATTVGLPVAAELVEPNESAVDRARIELETRQQIMLEAAEAQIVTASPEIDEEEAAAAAKLSSDKRRRRYCFMISSVIILAAAAATVGALAAAGQLQGSPSEDSPTSIVNEVGVTRTPANLGTDAPSISMSPTTAAPSETPSNSPTLGDNNFCLSAHPVDIGNGNAISTNFRSDLDMKAFNLCEFGQSSILSSGPGLWYKYRGKDMPVTVKVSDGLEVRIGTFDDMDNCDADAALQCIPDTIYSNRVRRATWLGDEGVDYYLLVVSSTLEGPPFLEVELFDNNERVNAFGPIDVSASVITLLGTTEKGQVLNMEDGAIPACDSADVPTSPGVWYSVLGTGAQISASTCGQTDLDTQISVFLEVGAGQNTAAGMLSCVVGNNDACRSLQSRAVWDGAPGVIYYIFVHGRGDEVGSFTLTVSDDGDSGTTVADGDFCTNAIEADRIVHRVDGNIGDTGDLTIKPHLNVSMVGATQDSDVVDGCTSDFSSSVYFEGLPYGLWYRVTGTGETFEAVLFDKPANAHPPEIAIGIMSHLPTSSETRSACLNLMCATTIACDPWDSACSWETTIDVIYYVYVHRGLIEVDYPFSLSIRAT